ncbi:hypothetical protein ACFVHA_28850, partial [Bacillus cereus]
ALAGEIENVAEFCRQHRMRRQRFWKWRRLFVADGLAGLERGRDDRAQRRGVWVATSRRWLSPRERVCSPQGLDHGPQSIVWTLQREGNDAAPAHAQPNGELRTGTG